MFYSIILSDHPFLTPQQGNLVSLVTTRTKGSLDYSFKLVYGPKLRQLVSISPSQMRKELFLTVTSAMVKPPSFFAKRQKSSQRLCHISLPHTHTYTQTHTHTKSIPVTFTQKDPSHLIAEQTLTHPSPLKKYSKQFNPQRNRQERKTDSKAE